MIIPVFDHRTDGWVPEEQRTSDHCLRRQLMNIRLGAEGIDTLVAGRFMPTVALGIDQIRAGFDLGKCGLLRLHRVPPGFRYSCS